MGSNGLSPAVVVDDQATLLGTERFLCPPTPLAMPTGTRVPAYTDSRPDGEPVHVGTGRRNVADDLMPRHQRVTGNAPVIVDHGKVAVADPAVSHPHIDLVRPERAGFILERLESLLRTLGRICFHCHSVTPKNREFKSSTLICRLARSSRQVGLAGGCAGAATQARRADRGGMSTIGFRPRDAPVKTDRRRNVNSLQEANRMLD